MVVTVAVVCRAITAVPIQRMCSLDLERSGRDCLGGESIGVVASALHQGCQTSWLPVAHIVTGASQCCIEITGKSNGIVFCSVEEIMGLLVVEELYLSAGAGECCIGAICCWNVRRSAFFTLAPVFTPRSTTSNLVAVLPLGNIKLSEPPVRVRIFL